MHSLLLALVVFGAFSLFIGLMAVGVIFSNRSIKGSCGGLAAMKTENGETSCEICGAPAVESCRIADSKYRSQFGAF